MTRREFLKHAGQAALLTTGGTLGFESASTAPSGSHVAGDWPMYRGSRCLTGRAVLPGEMRAAPQIAWQHKIEAGLVWALIDAVPGRSSRPVEVRSSALA